MKQVGFGIMPSISILQIIAQQQSKPREDQLLERFENSGRQLLVQNLTASEFFRLLGNRLCYLRIEYHQDRSLTAQQKERFEEQLNVIFNQYLKAYNQTVPPEYWYEDQYEAPIEKPPQ